MFVRNKKRINKNLVIFDGLSRSLTRMKQKLKMLIHWIVVLIKFFAVAYHFFVFLFFFSVGKLENIGCWTSTLQKRNVLHWNCLLGDILDDVIVNRKKKNCDTISQCFQFIAPTQFKCRNSFLTIKTYLFHFFLLKKAKCISMKSIAIFPSFK